MEGVTRKAGIDARITVTGAQPPAETNPFLIYDLGGKFDASFNQSASEGAQAWSAATGDSYGEFEIQSESQREQALDRAAASSANYAPIVTIGFGFVDALDVVAPDYPDRSFAIIDAVVNQPNVSSVVFAEYEAAYVMGVVAVLASETDTVGFVGGIDIPFIRQFSTAFEQGVLDTDPDARVIVSMAGTTPAALNDPVRGGELANAQMAQGADVIYAVAAGTGLGVFQAVADAGRLAIGTYSNVQDFFPGTMLTTMEKHVDVAVEHVFGAGADLQPGLIELGLADGALGYGYGDFNRTLLTQDMRDAADAAIADIIAGRIVVEDYLDFGL
ncbi:BMP family lipoprotein [Albidovulum sp.]|uniref:BMP family lipoprotein n=1 Tax=Albidovulum sp. TaxID=1872424 RepID=UPI003D7D2103